MSHKTTRKGGRSWWGKRETKAASKVTRRRDDKEHAAYCEFLDRQAEFEAVIREGYR